MNRKGFTLIEIMIALTIFAILALITSSALYQAFNTRARLNVQADRLNTIQLAMTMLERDIGAINGRAIRGNEMHVFSAFVGRHDYLEFTRGGVVNPNGVERISTEKRVAYLCNKGQLLRRSWVMLDMPDRQKFHDKVILNNLNTCTFAYLAQNHQVLSEWREHALDQNQKNTPFPQAVQFTLQLHDWGDLNLLFIIPGGLYG